MYGGSLLLVGFHVAGMSLGSWWPSVGLRRDNRIHSALDGHSKNSPNFRKIEVEHGKI